MPVPLVSRRRWEELPGNREVVDPARSRLRWLRDGDDHTHLGLFKRPPQDAALREMYSVALDRVGYVLGDALGLPVVPVHLETFEDEPGAVVLELRNHCSWSTFLREGRRGRLINMDVIGLCVAFDIWLANYDRAKKNVLLQPEPPELAWDSEPDYRLVLIDYGQTCLWPPAKMNLGEDDVPGAAEVGDGSTIREDLIVQRMDGGYWSVYRDLSDDDRAAVHARIQDMGDPVISAALEDIPEPFMTDDERERTLDLLKARRDRVDDLSRGLLQ